MINVPLFLHGINSLPFSTLHQGKIKALEMYALEVRVSGVILEVVLCQQRIIQFNTPADRQHIITVSFLAGTFAHVSALKKFTEAIIDLF